PEILFFSLIFVQYNLENHSRYLYQLIFKSRYQKSYLSLLISSSYMYISNTYIFPITYI
ncbi:hypothetical protein L9F63_014025, partial [Diploptera punctata]